MDHGIVGIVRGFLIICGQPEDVVSDLFTTVGAWAKVLGSVKGPRPGAASAAIPWRCSPSDGVLN